MEQLSVIKKMGNSISSVAGRTKFKIEKNSPEILLGFGIVGFIGTVVLASRATLRAEDIVEKHREELKAIEDAKEIAQNEPEKYEYDEKLIVMDKAGIYGRMSVDFTKLYGPSIALGALSLACILTSKNIMNKRYLGAVAAYNAVSGAFETYRQRVREEQGEIMDRHFRYGTELEEITVTTVDENGKKIKEKQLVEKDVQNDLALPDENAVWFDEENPNWDKNPEYNLMFLRSQQNYWNDILHTRGHVFLNEVRESLGFPHTQAGAILGWVKGFGDEDIDFGLYDMKRKSTRDFINGATNIVLLEFNHDGVIWDKIDNP